MFTKQNLFIKLHYQSIYVYHNKQWVSSSFQRKTKEFSLENIKVHFCKTILYTLYKKVVFDSLVVFCKLNMHPCFFLVNSGPLMLSMQYSNNNLSQQHQYSSHQHGLRSRYNLKHNSSNHHKRNRRLSGTFIPEHHLITVPPSQTAKNVSPISNPVEMFVPRKNYLEKLH